MTISQPGCCRTPSDYARNLCSELVAANLLIMPQRPGNRREKRIAVVIPVRLWGMDARGKPFIEASRTANVSRTGVLLKEVPAKLAAGDVVGLRYKEKKYRFRVIWVEAGNVGLRCLESGKWLWDELGLPADDVDIYAQPLPTERRRQHRVRCFLSAEAVCDGEKILALIKDISVGGCYVAMTFPFPLEAKVSIAIGMDGQTKIWVDGVVISRHASTGMGVKFVGLTRPNAKIIEDMVKESLKAEASHILPSRA